MTKVGAGRLWSGGETSNEYQARRLQWPGRNPGPFACGRFAGAVRIPETPTTTNEKARVHPASPAQDRGRHATRQEGFIAQTDNA
jgi:hypothetical protein